MNPQPWFRRWFGKEYLDLYPHRDVDEARRAVNLLLDVVKPAPRAPVLDLACGAGRHVVEMSRSGLAVTGLDLSAALLFEARSTDPRARLVRADMRRLPFAAESFQVVTSFFTSFGYFEDPADDGKVLAEARRSLRPGGYFLLDFLNSERVRANLEPYDVRELDGARIHQERALVEDGRVVEKRIRIEEQAGPGRTFTERVRLYRAEELLTMLRAARLEPAERFGDYGGALFGADAPRFLVIGRAF